MKRVECFNKLSSSDINGILQGKTNFFEKRVGEYSNTANPEMESNHEFALNDDF